MSPKVSVIIPIYNVEKYVRDCLESVCNQTLRDIEIICVNDGSTDSSQSIVDEYATNDSRIISIQKKNAGYGAALNDGLDRAKGDYIGIVEPDDFVKPTMYETLYSHASSHENPIDIVKCAWEDYTADCILIQKNNPYQNIPEATTISIRDYPRVLLSHPSTPMGIYRRGMLQSHGIRYVEAPGAGWVDNPFFLESYFASKSLVVTSDAFYCYRRGREGSSSELADCSIPFLRLIDMFDFLDGKKEHGPFRFYTTKRVFIYLREVLNSRRYPDQRESVKPLIKSVMNRLDKSILKEALFTESDRCNYHRFKGDTPVSKRVPNPLVSVIIPCYNTEKYIAQCLDSLASQTLAAYEAICVDDGSSDFTRAVVQSYAETDERISAICSYDDLEKETNRGAGAARNKGMELAKGKYLYFLDSDDYIEKTILEKSVMRAELDDSDIVIFKAYAYDDKKKSRVDARWAFRKENTPPSPFHPSEMPDHLFNSFQTWPHNKLFRKQFLCNMNIRFQELHRTNDLLFVDSALTLADKISLLPEFGINYRFNTQSSCQSTNSLHPFDFYTALMGLKDHLNDGHIWNLYKTSFLNAALEGSIYNLRSQKSTRAFLDLYDFLRNEGYEELGVNDAPRELFRSVDAYTTYESIMNTPSEDLLPRNWAKLDSPANSLEVSSLERENEGLKRKVSNLQHCNSYKIGRLITYVPRLIKRKLKGKR